MNIVLVTNDNRQAMLVYDQPLGFTSAWAEFSTTDGHSVKVYSEEGVEAPFGTLYPQVGAKLQGVHEIILVQISNAHDSKNPVTAESQKIPLVTGCKVPLVNQSY